MGGLCLEDEGKTKGDSEPVWVLLKYLLRLVGGFCLEDEGKIFWEP